MVMLYMSCYHGHVREMRLPEVKYLKEGCSVYHSPYPWEGSSHSVGKSDS